MLLCRRSHCSQLYCLCQSVGVTLPPAYSTCFCHAYCLFQASFRLFYTLPQVPEVSPQLTALMCLLCVQLVSLSHLLQRLPCPLLIASVCAAGVTLSQPLMSALPTAHRLCVCSWCHCPTSSNVPQPSAAPSPHLLSCPAYPPSSSILSTPLISQSHILLSFLPTSPLSSLPHTTTTCPTPSSTLCVQLMSLSHLL